MNKVKRSMDLYFLTVGAIVGILVGLRILLNPCDEIECLINLFFPMPIGLGAGVLTFLWLFVIWKYAGNLRFKKLYWAALGITIALSVLISMVFQQIEGFALLLNPHALVYAVVKLWWVYALVIGVSAVAVRFVKSKNIRSRFWALLILFLLVGTAHGIAFSRIIDFDYQERLKSLALEQNDIDVCDGIIFNWMRDNCYSDLARKNKDVSMCQKIRDRFTYNDVCITGIAIETNNPELCKSIVQFDNTRCYTYLAQQLHDETLCQLITPYSNQYAYKSNVERCINEARAIY